MPEAQIANNQVQPEDAIVLSEREERLAAAFTDMLVTAEEFSREGFSATTMAASLRHDFAETTPNFEDILRVARVRAERDVDLTETFTGMLRLAEKPGSGKTVEQIIASLRDQCGEVPNFEDILRVAQSRLTEDSNGVRAR